MPRFACTRSALALSAFLLATGCRQTTAVTDYTLGPALDGPRQRGGHVIFVREEDPDFLDPALSYGTYTAPLIEGVFRTLLEYADVPGLAGTRLEPELARSLPDVREGGRLYAFALRPDAKFGAPLHRHITAADVKYSIERLFQVGSPGCNFYRGIVGVDRVLAGKAKTIPGIVARGDSLYFRLVEPDPIFTSVLTLPFTAPVPREVTEQHPNDFSQHTVATGPFQIAEFTPRRRVLLVRNPDYCGQPAWLDTFEMRLGVSTVTSVALIRRGLVDGGFFEVPAGEFARLGSDSVWKHQLLIADGINTDYLFMNVRIPPFDDVRVRQAVNWALDRRALMKVYSGKAIPAGEFLPPSIPGYRPLGAYQGPDTARARALLRAAGHPNGISVRLYAYSTEPFGRMMTLVQQQLAAAGIHAELDLGEAAGYTSMAEVVSNHIAFGLYGWYADYVDASNFFDTLLNGHRIQPIHNINLSLFDDARTNAMIEQAMRTADDSTRFRMWGDVDRRVMDLAPVAPLLHLQESRLYSPRLGGWYRHVSRLFKIESLYIKPKSAAPGPA